MLVTKHLAELCSLITNDVCGEIPSRVLEALFIRGRSTIGQLAQHTSLHSRQLKHGLVVLVQKNLLYHHTSKETRVTWYEVNPSACYNLIRVGKVLDMIAEQHGPASEEVARSLILLGHHRIKDLEEQIACTQFDATYEDNDASRDSICGLSGHTRSMSHFHHTLHELLDADLLDVVGKRSFHSPEDTHQEVENEVSTGAHGDRLGKSKAEMQRILSQRMLDVQQESKHLKQRLRQASGPPIKRRRIETSDYHGADEDDGFRLDSNAIIRLDYDKCLVELRNRSLARFAADVLGETSGKVFYSLLQILTKNISKCGGTEDTGGSGSSRLKATTFEILEHLGDNVDISKGIGKASSEELDLSNIERAKSSPGPAGINSTDSDDNNGGAATKRDSDLDSDNESYHKDSLLEEGHLSTEAQHVTEMHDDRVEQLRQHLFLLAESTQQFIRLCGRQDRGQWTVDFPQLMEKFRQMEMDAVIEQSFGRQGLRLVRLLRENGKMDEKALPTTSMMKKSEVQSTMLAMQVGGIVDIQEVPKDNSRLANRTLFFWFFDHDRYRSQLLDRLYKMMLRCLQVLEMHRGKERMLLAFVEREDVRGKEEEIMSAEHFDRYTAHRELEKKLIGQVMRLDDAVAVLRDY